MEKKSLYTDSQEHYDNIDEHVKKYDDIENRNHFMKLATRLFLDSRRNKGKFTRIK
jgi:transposase-like protein